MNEETKKILEKQLELLSKQSEICEPNELCNLTDSMINVINRLTNEIVAF